jgi:Rps23 Pro-64 3,4-dihydroxylase Tpa1-like proline 4-hydroxylase
MTANAAKVLRSDDMIQTRDIPLACNPALDLDRLAERFQETGRVRIPAFLGSGSADMRDYLEQTDEWIQVINKPGGVLEMELNEWQALGSRRKSVIQRDMYARGARGFQYSYAAIRIPTEDELDDDDSPLADFSRFMMSVGLRETVEAIIGSENLHFTDGQATAYGLGDFLTGHDDDVPGRDRVAALVLGMTPVWRLEWGGLLIFHPTPSADALALVPAFNTLDLFAVPVLHSVSQVMPCAEGPRHALTGWLSRASQD